MIDPSDLNRPILEGLYAEGMALADSIRDAFDLSGRLTQAAEDEDLSRLALSCQSLRATTRIMHAIAWLVNHRAYLDGEMSEFQLRQHGRLPASPPSADDEELEFLSTHMKAAVLASELFYSRIERLDRAWRKRFMMQPSAVERVKARIGVPASVR